MQLFPLEGTAKKSTIILWEILQLVLKYSSFAFIVAITIGDAEVVMEE